MQKKFPDKGNKRRFFKNFFRLIKNPFGYAYWKTFKIRQPKGRIITTMLGLGLVSTLWKYKVESSKRMKLCKTKFRRSRCTCCARVKTQKEAD